MCSCASLALLLASGSVAATMGCDHASAVATAGVLANTGPPSIFEMYVFVCVCVCVSMLDSGHEGPRVTGVEVGRQSSYLRLGSRVGVSQAQERSGISQTHTCSSTRHIQKQIQYEAL